MVCFGTNFAHEANNQEPNPNITPFNEAADAQNGLSKAYLLQQPAWLSFKNNHQDWGATFSPYTQLPHRAFGTPISVALGGSDPVQKAKAFIQTELAQFNIPVQELVLTRNYNDGKFIHVDFKQIHNNMEVLWSRVTVRFSQDLKIVLIGIDAHRNIPQLNVALSPSNAMVAAENAISTTIVNSVVDSKVFLFPLPIEGKFNYRPVYRVNVHTQDDNETPGNYLTYVDAINGNILYRQNKVVHVGFNVNADLFPTNLFSPQANLPLKNILVNYNSTNYYTDLTGLVTLPNAGPYNATLSLSGKFIKIVTGQNGTVSPTFAVTNAAQGSSVTFPQSSPDATERHTTCYYHANEIHDFMKSRLSSFTAMDNPLTTRVDRTDGNCNAFYNGSSINFYTTANGCNALSQVNSVIYHEYGHGITNVFWNDQGSSFDNGGMGEGYSDVWSIAITKSPIVGAGFNINQPTSFIRRYDVNPKVYPINLVGQVHADGEIIAGAWYDFAVNLGGNFSDAVDTMSTIFADSHYGLANGPDGTEGTVYHDILIDALQYDDNDNNINNGTPHFLPLVQGFAQHGIYLLSNTEINHNSPGVIQANTAASIQADAIADYPAFLGDVKMFYRLRGTTSTDSILMTKNVNTYSANFPSTTTIGQVYEYYFSVYDIANTPSAQSPISAKFNIASLQRNLPHFLLVGYNSVFLQNFDQITNTTPNWTIGNNIGDLATGGKWIVDTPISSAISGDTVQTGRDHTASSGLGFCAVTGNATSALASVGNSDVDGGRTTLITEEFDLNPYNKAIVSYWRWFSNSQGQNPRKDHWRVYGSYNNGTNWFQIERTYQPDVSWRRNIFIPDMSQGGKVRFMFVATDTATAGGGAWVEAAVDDIEILDLGAPANINHIESLQATAYPNPAQNELNIISADKGQLNITLMNSLGQVLFTTNKQTLGLTQVNIAEIPNGFYFVKLQINQKSTILKLRISH